MFKVIFQSNSKSFHLFVVVFFVYSGRLGVIYNSQATNRRAVRVLGRLTEFPPCFLLVA
jgi:hypothetical protein